MASVQTAQPAQPALRTIETRIPVYPVRDAAGEVVGIVSMDDIIERPPPPA